MEIGRRLDDGKTTARGLSGGDVLVTEWSIKARMLVVRLQSHVVSSTKCVCSSQQTSDVIVILYMTTVVKFEAK